MAEAIIMITWANLVTCGGGGIVSGRACLIWQKNLPDQTCGVAPLWKSEKLKVGRFYITVYFSKALNFYIVCSSLSNTTILCLLKSKRPTKHRSWLNNLSMVNIENTALKAKKVIQRLQSKPNQQDDSIIKGINITPLLYIKWFC